MNTIVKRSISSAAARKMIDAAERKAAEISIAMSIAVVDESGTLKAFLRMDGAAHSSLQVSTEKAVTAASFGVPTDQWYGFIKDDGALLHGLPSMAGVSIIGGGYPIYEEGAIVGAIGAAGGLYTQDMDVAQAGLAALD